jgi:RNA polymerase sigma-70 factor, ECF subfamily
MDPTGTLITAARDRDRRAIEELLVQHLPPLEAFLRLRMGPALRAQLTAPDLVQSVCREVLEDLSGFEYRGEAAFRHWLYTRAQNKVLEKHRYIAADKRSAAHEQAMPDATTLLPSYQTLLTPSRVLAARESVARIETAFDELPDDYREAVTLHRLCGLSHAEIAARMGRSEGAVRNLVYRGMSRLALRVEELDGGTAPG